MASMTPGTGGTLKSTTLENALYEAIALLEIYEKDTTKNPSALRRAIIQTNQVTRTITLGFTFDLVKTFNPITYTPRDYLTAAGYVTGNNGTITSATIQGAILELAERIQSREQDASKNPASTNNITLLTYDSETLQVDCRATFELLVSLTSTGTVETRVNPYLLD